MGETWEVMQLEKIGANFTDFMQLHYHRWYLQQYCCSKSPSTMVQANDLAASMFKLVYKDGWNMLEYTCGQHWILIMLYFHGYLHIPTTCEENTEL